MDIVRAKSSRIQQSRTIGELFAGIPYGGCRTFLFTVIVIVAAILNAAAQADINQTYCRHDETFTWPSFAQMSTGAGCGPVLDRQDRAVTARRRRT